MPENPLEQMENPQDLGHEDADFTLTADEASRLMGVNRSRLSQLTQKGVFPYQRKRVGMRSRLFYRLKDILKYQRAYTYGDRAPSAEESSYEVLTKEGTLTLTSHPPFKRVGAGLANDVAFEKNSHPPENLRLGNSLLKTGIARAKSIPLKLALDVYQEKINVQTLKHVKDLLEKNTEKTLVEVKNLCERLMRGQAVQRLWDSVPTAENARKNTTPPLKKTLENRVLALEVSEVKGLEKKERRSFPRSVSVHARRQSVWR